MFLQTFPVNISVSKVEKPNYFCTVPSCHQQAHALGQDFGTNKARLHLKNTSQVFIWSLCIGTQDCKVLFR